MSIVRLILVVLICASPLILLRDGLIAQGLLAGIIAVALGITALTLLPGETEFLVSVICRVAAVAAVPALWILFQVVPLEPLAHPIWSSAQAALGHTIYGEISADPGASIIRFGGYIALCAVFFVSAAVAVDRRRAEPLLFALTAATAISAGLIIGHDLLFSDIELSALMREQAVDCSALGVVIASAACIRIFERYKTRHGKSKQSLSLLVWALLACGLALTMCIVALLLDGTREVFVATGSGLGALASVVIIRRLGLGMWSFVGLCVALVGVAFLVFASRPAEPGKSVLIAFAAPFSSTAPDVSARVLQDAPLVGTGAGTFAALAQIYREMGDPQPRSTASTAAATLAVELGRPMLWLIVAAAVVFLFALLRASLQRGRDYFYPAMGGAGLLVLVLLGFINAGVLGTAAGLFTAVVLGLAFAQSKSRTLRPQSA